ncbi:hypothetical protein VB005_02446 [Metarhizium brunneum]
MPYTWKNMRGSTRLSKSIARRMVYQLRSVTRASGLHRRYWNWKEQPHSAAVIGAPLATEATSGNVHSYRDHAVDSPDKSSPLLYADCEGFKRSGRGEFELALNEEQLAQQPSTGAKQHFRKMVGRGYNYVRHKVFGMTDRDDTVQ